MKPECSVVFFDADGVVQSPSPRWFSRLTELCGDWERADKFVADVLGAESEALDGRSDVQPSLRKVLNEWGLDLTVPELLQIWTEISVSQDSLEIIAKLRENRVTVALASNQVKSRARFMTESLGYESVFDFLFFSCELGFAKPDPTFFERILSDVAIAAESAVFIDDKDENVRAAREIGMHGYRFHTSDGVSALRRVLSNHGLIEPIARADRRASL